jgi:DNA-binding response OmpR family regulator
MGSKPTSTKTLQSTRSAHKSIGLGADDYLIKPFEGEKLVARVGITLIRENRRRMVLWGPSMAACTMSY